MTLMEISKSGIELIKKFESCRLNAYKALSSEKYYTIGWGHYGADVKPNMTISQTDADNLLKKDLIPIRLVLNGMRINFSQNQFDALSDFIFNLGVGNFNSSTLKKKILANASDVETTDQITKWVNAGGKPSLGLKRRRVEEANLFLGRTLYKIDCNGNITKA